MTAVDGRAQKEQAMADPKKKNKKRGKKENPAPLATGVVLDVKTVSFEEVLAHVDTDEEAEIVPPPPAPSSHSPSSSAWLKRTINSPRNVPKRRFGP